MMQKLGNFGRKLRKFWSEHRFLVFLWVFTLVLAVGVIFAVRGRGSDVCFGGLAVDVTVSEEGCHYLQQGFAARHDFDEDGLPLTKMSLTAPDGVETGEIDYGGAIYAMLLASNREVDYFLLDETALRTMLPQQMFLDLRQIFSDKELAQLGNLVVRTLPVDENDVPTETGEYPVALNLSNLLFVRECMVSDEAIYICFAAGSERETLFADFWSYLNEWD